MKNNIGKLSWVLAAVFLFLSPMVFADAATDAILAPLNKIKGLAQAIISAIAVIVILFAGAKFMFSGENMQARETSKSMLTYSVIGLVIVWAAHLLVKFLTAPAV
mgnify:CR=1 FL=1